MKKSQSGRGMYDDVDDDDRQVPFLCSVSTTPPTTCDSCTAVFKLVHGFYTKMHTSHYLTLGAAWAFQLSVDVRRRSVGRTEISYPGRQCLSDVHVSLCDSCLTILLHQRCFAFCLCLVRLVSESGPVNAASRSHHLYTAAPDLQ